MDDRIKIHKIISKNRDDDGAMSIILKDIGNMLEKDPSSISKEVKLHRVKKNRPDYFAYKFSNAICEHYSTCNKQSSNLHKFLKCSTKCINSYKDFEEYVCPNLKKFPWVCNGCKKDQKCRLNKYFYYSDIANQEYKNILSESREGVNLTPDEFKLLNHIVSNNVFKGQPIISSRLVFNYHL